MATEKGVNGYDNRGYDNKTEKGVDHISKTPGSERNANPFLEENSVGSSSSLRMNNRTPFKILLVSLIFLVAAIIALGITLFIVINDDSAAVFKAIKVTTESPVETTTKPPTTGPTIAETSRTMSRVFETTTKSSWETTTQSPATTSTEETSVVEIGVNVILVDRTYTEDLGDKSTPDYVAFTTEIVSLIDATYQNDIYYREAIILSVSPGSIKLDLMITYNIPVNETERSNALEFMLDNLTPNMQNAMGRTAVIDILTPACDIDPCSNGGLCNNIPNTSDYTCTCQEGYTGKSCQYDIDECMNNPCENGGQCDITEGSYTCICTDGFTGMHCEQSIDRCVNDPCENGAQCENAGGTYRCICTDGYMGTNCGQEAQVTVEPGYDISLAVGGSGSFTYKCVNGDASSQLYPTWTNEDGQVIQTSAGGGNERVYTTESIEPVSGEFLYITRLTFSNVEITEDGVYTCSVNSDEESRRIIISIPITFPVMEAESSQRLLINQNGRVECTINSNPFPSVYWKINGQFIDQTNTEDRYTFSTQMIVEPEKPGFERAEIAILEVRDVIAEDAGSYVCFATVDSTGSTDTLTIAVFVQVPPEWTVQPEDVQGVEGSSVTIQCAASGNPDPTYTWTDQSGQAITPVEGKYELVDDGEFFTIHNLESADDQTYVCTASNDAINSTTTTEITDTVRLEVLIPPALNAQDNETVIEGELFSMDCIITRPDATGTLSWRRYGITEDYIVNEGTWNLDSRVSVTRKDEGRTLTLSLSPSNYDHSGGWTCFVESDAGDAHVTHYLSVEYIDECVNSPCQHGGICENTLGSYTCLCTSGYMGHDCQQDIDECSSGPCENGGQCNNTDGSYFCFCTIGFTGMNCEYVMSTDCGNRPALSSSSPRIIGGSQTQLGDWPWMVSLRDRSNVHRCAAVLINSTRAITAAHCVKKFDTAVLGDLKLSMTSPYHVQMEVQAAIHPDYDINTITNDIAVIKFSLLEYNDYIQPICVHNHGASTTFKACYVTGWGHTSEGGQVSDTLLEAMVELFDQARCQSFYPTHTITSTMLCAGHLSGSTDTCQGDTGGPLQCEDQDGRFHLIGITSFGIGCGRENYPGVYTKVSEYYDFITSADPQPDPEPVVAVDLFPGRLFEVTYLRVAYLEYQWILNAVEGNAIDLYIFTLDIVQLLDTVLIGYGSDPTNLETIIVDSRNGPVPHFYRIFNEYAWIRLVTSPEPIALLPGVNALAEGILVHTRENSNFCTDQPCGEGNICMANAVGYSCVCQRVSSGSACKDLYHNFSGEAITYIDRQISTSSDIECTFDTDWCGWTQIQFVENLDWNMTHGNEPWNFIGPFTDHTEPGVGGHYIYAEALEEDTHYTAALASSKFWGTRTDQRQCFTFYYFISSGDNVNFTVYFVSENSTIPEPVWTLPGKILNRWLIGEFKLGAAGWFIIEAMLDGHPLGFISVDDIQFTDCLLNGNIEEDITLVPGNVVYMSSPNFPNVYPNDVSQLWTITVPEGYGARFDIDVINIEDPFERLAIGTGHDPTDKSSILGSWTGHHLLQNVTRVSLQYWVSFKSDLTIREQGFVIAIYPVKFEEYFMTMECGELLNITSPNYPMTYPHSQLLLWLLTAPPQHGLYFRFARFETESQRDMVIVGTGESPSPDAGIRLAVLSGFITPSDIVSDDNKAWIMFRPDFESTEASGFFVEVRTVERPDCNASNAFQCPNGRCISTAALCDNYNDCQDFIDEEYCPMCVDVPASCNQLLPYNMTYFPNQHATSAADADNILGKVTSSCPQDSNHLQLACNMLFPECPHHGPTRQPCKSSCMDELELCAAVYEAQHGEEWPLICDSLPETEEDLLGRCTGPSADILHTSICGTRPAYNPYQPRIVGGVNAQEGEFPWMAYLYSEDYGQYCGATLVSSEWIVTAAHCLWGITDLLDSVIMGDLHLSINSEHHLAIAPDDIFIHPEYNDTTLNADIAFIKLSEHVSFSEYVRPACLSQTLHEDTDYTTCIIAGWGNTEHDEADNLQKASVRLIEVERCKELYEVPDDYDTGYLVCAGFERGGIDTCQGDSGGPLVCEGADGRWHLTGVTSFGNGCADPGFPGIYARVSTLLPFLESILLEYLETISLQDQDDEVQITSPGYPELYDANIDKTWYIVAPHGYSILVAFLVFRVESGYDVLTVYEGVTSDEEERVVSYRLSGYLPPPSFTSFGSHVWLQFTSDNTVQDQGFLLVVSLVKGIDCSDADMFNCSNGRCIHLNFTCNGFNDCVDFSDEDFCPPCVEIPEPCRSLVRYSNTYFPNAYSTSEQDSQAALQLLANQSELDQCHDGLMELVCSAYFPECIHNGPTRRPCLSECLDVTNACEPLYEEMVGQPWPINCTHFTDSQPDNEGSCLGGRGDYFNTMVCGTRPAYTQDQSRIVGGTNAKEGEFPWMVYLYDHDRGQVCGGTLIAPEWIITAAHCVVNIPYTVDHVILGDLLLSSPSNHHLNLSLAEIIVYPGYNTETFDGDVALIRLSRPVSFTDYLRPACLGESSEEVQDYKRCTVSGWGDTESHFIADVLQKAVVGLIPQETCARLYPGETTDLMMCAGYERGGIDTCQGDSGGPLVCEGEDGRWHLVGVTSWGEGCADPGYPGIYARVSRFISFITETVNQHSSDESSVIILAVDDVKQISSPNWPLDYESNTDLTWHVIAPRDHSIVITFISFDLERSFDLLEIYQGASGIFDQSYLSHVLTGNQLPDEITTFTSFAWLQFTSDVDVTREGFFLILSVTELRGCSDGMFNCSSGLCISINATCDGFNDCFDFSDEEYCPVCEEVPHVCRDLVPYSSTYFPNPFAETREDALEKALDLDALLIDCHEDIMELTCRAYFPECIHHGPTRRPCSSNCLEVSNACEQLYEEMVGQTWPINCTHFTDSQPDNEGSCLGGEGDFLNTTICGTRPAYTQDQSRVIGGFDAEEGEFPWTVYLKDTNGSQFCSGALIGTEWVATSAHCVDGDFYSLDSIVLGDQLLSSQSSHHLSIRPAEIISHPKYNKSPSFSFDGDFALIRLSQPVNFTEYIRPVCLAKSSKEIEDYKRCTASGWGNYVLGLNINILQKGIVHLVSNERCAELYRNRTSDLMICAGLVQRDMFACRGGGGGPLVCEGSDGRWHLVGVTSWGEGCIYIGKPDIYARVSQFVPFVEEVLARNDVVLPTAEPDFIQINLSIGEPYEITSPNYPELYPNNLHRIWEIVPPLDAAILIHFIDFELEDPYDFLYIYNGETYSNETLVARITDVNRPRDLAEVTSKMWIRFQSDSAVGRHGFRLTLTAIRVPYNGSCGLSCCTGPLESCNRGDCYCDVQCFSFGDCCWDFQENCHVQATPTPYFFYSTLSPGDRVDLELGETAVITSPNYPQNYPNNTDILWNIHVPSSYRVLLQFIAFNTEDGYDFLYVYAGRDPETILTGSRNFDDIISSGSFMQLRFETDGSVGRYGFSLQLSMVHETELASCSNGEEIPISFICDDVLHCPDGGDESNCPPIILANGESATFVMSSNPNFVQESSLERSFLSNDSSLALVVMVEFIHLLPGDVIVISTVDADEDFVWAMEGPLSQDYSQASDKVFTHGHIVVQATTLNGTRDVMLQVTATHLQDITSCEGSDRLIVPQKVCDGIVDCPDFTDEQDCGPLKTISLNLGEIATIQSPGYPRFLTTSLPLRMVWTIQVASPSRIVVNVSSLVTKASHMLMVGSGLDDRDESSVLFKIYGIPFYDEYGVRLRKISPPGNSMWISIEKLYTDSPSELVLAAYIEAVTEESLQCPPSQLSCGGIFLGCYDETSSCDGYNDCFDGSDEDCACPGILEVRSGLTNTCLHRRNFCDDVVNSGDDESDCTFVCDNGRVVSERFACDGYNDCGDFTDEPPECVCAANQFDCGERCISINDVCNENVDCANGADEANCICKSYEFQCDDGQCKPYWERLDGKDDCDDGSDENQENFRECPGNYFQCRDFSQCLPASYACSGYRECKDGSDEWNCFWSQNTTIPPFIEPTESPIPTGQSPPLSFIPFEDCGLRPALEIHRVTHGEDVTGLGEWPWQIALYTSTGQFSCGGSIITSEWILTAAHCVEDPAATYYIKAGSLTYPRFEGGGQLGDVGQVIKHPLYNRGTLINDIALLKLVTPLNLTNEVQPVCLPSADESIPKPEEYVTFTGWGSFTERYSALPDLLQEGRMPVVPNYFCDHYISVLSVEPTMFCTMYHKGLQGVCTGDSGGPIVQEINGRWTLVGISSWVEICGTPYIPNGFTRVSSFIDFVQSMMTQN